MTLSPTSSTRRSSASGMSRIGGMRRPWALISIRLPHRWYTAGPTCSYAVTGSSRARGGVPRPTPKRRPASRRARVAITATAPVASRPALMTRPPTGTRGAPRAGAGGRARRRWREDGVKTCNRAVCTGRSDPETPDRPASPAEIRRKGGATRAADTRKMPRACSRDPDRGPSLACRLGRYPGGTVQRGRIQACAACRNGGVGANTSGQARGRSGPKCGV